jgi:D-alanine-D-alanine ligase
MILIDREIYVLETNTIPGMTATSLLLQVAQVGGPSLSQLMDNLIELALEAHQD